MREDSEGYAKLFTALNRFGADALTTGQVDALVRTSVRYRYPLSTLPCQAYALLARRYLALSVPYPVSLVHLLSWRASRLAAAACWLAGGRVVGAVHNRDCRSCGVCCAAVHMGFVEL